MHAISNMCAILCSLQRYVACWYPTYRRNNLVPGSQGPPCRASHPGLKGIIPCLQKFKNRKNLMAQTSHPRGHTASNTPPKVTVLANRDTAQARDASSPTAGRLSTLSVSPEGLQRSGSSSTVRPPVFNSDGTTGRTAITDDTL